MINDPAGTGRSQTSRMLEVAVVGMGAAESLAAIVQRHLVGMSKSGGDLV
jgi:hypothetical protein